MKITSGVRPRASIVLLLVLLALGAAPTTGADDGSPWNYLPVDSIGAGAWRAAHPAWDGRGVVVAILDTGVDAFAPGLETTTTGLTKIIEARDFTPEGEWELAAAELEDGVLVHPENDLRLEGFADLAVPPSLEDLEADPVWIGVFPERSFKNSGDVADPNDNGREDERYGFLVYTAERQWAEHALGVGRGLELLYSLNETAAAAVEKERRSEKVWIVVVDTDADGHLDDEKVLRDYHVDWDTFGPVDPEDPEARTLMAWSVNVRANEDFLGNPLPPTLETHFDSGSHGSHCAGIASGHGVSGQPGIDGVAPGAWLISMKLGDNRLSGGATRTESMKKAYEHAAEFGETYGLPVVVNMSFGINSVEEGDDAMGLWLEDFLAEHPDFYVCQSAGNEGPGLSTVGLPSTGPSVITTGALLPVEAARDLYRARIPQDFLFDFSSRGGESAKPDIVTPGTALSTVPGHVDGSARYHGTSMASPQTAGAVACLLSAAVDQGLTTHWGMVKRALIAGGVPVDGLSPVEQGGGLLNIANSWEVLKKLAASETARAVLDYRIETECPLQSDDVAGAAYWRTPGGVPVAPERVRFRVSPIFHPDLTADEKDTFFRSFTFRSEAPWLELHQDRAYIRGDMEMIVEVSYDGRRLAEPGFYSARVLAAQEGGDLSGLAGREFYLWNTVVVGENLDPAEGLTSVHEGKGLAPGGVHRYFAAVPAGATSLRGRLEVSARGGSAANTAAYLQVHDPEGAYKGGWSGWAGENAINVRGVELLGDEVYPGVYEFDVVGARTNASNLDYRLSISCDGYAGDPAVVTALPRDGAAETAAASLTVTRAFPGVFRGGIDAAVQGFRREREISVSESDVWSHSFTLDATTPRAEFHLEMDEATANLFTDCAVNISGADGRDIDGAGFAGLVCDMDVALPAGVESADYTLKVTGGFARKQLMEDWGFTLEEKYLLAAPAAGEVSRSGGGSTRLYCGVPVDLDLSFADAWPTPPDGMHAFGVVAFRDDRAADRMPADARGRLVFEVPIRLTD